MPSATTIADEDHDYLTERASIRLSKDEVQRRLKYEEAYAETQYHEVIAPKNSHGFIMCIGSMAVSALGILLAGIAIGHAILLPDATIWPMSVASLICAATAMVVGIAGLRGIK